MTFVPQSQRTEGNITESRVSDDNVQRLLARILKEMKNAICYGTNTIVSFTRYFSTPILLDTRFQDKISIIIQDDLTTLISFPLKFIS